MKIVFKLLDDERLSEAINLCNICFKENTSVEEAQKNFEAEKDDKHHMYIVGFTEDGKLVAHVRLQFIETIFSSMTSYAILNHVCVHPDYRRHRIGSKMLEYVSDICRDRGCKEIKLWSNNYRVASHALYKDFGFEKVDATFYNKELN